MEGQRLYLKCKDDSGERDPDIKLLHNDVLKVLLTESVWPVVFFTKWCVTG